METDLSRHDPNNPGEEQIYDGTPDGMTPISGDGLSPAGQQFADEALTSDWLELLWPTIQIELDAVYGACSAIVQLTVDILGTVQITSSNFAIDGIDLDDSETAQRVAQQVQQISVSTAKTGLALAVATFFVVVSSWLAINWGTCAIFLVNLLTWNCAMAAHLWAIYHNAANGVTTVEDAVCMVGSVFMTWITKMVGFAVGRYLLFDRIAGVLENIFGEMNQMAMKAVKWIMIVCGLCWIGIMVYEIGMILATQPVGGVFVAPSWAT